MAESTCRQVRFRGQARMSGFSWAQRQIWREIELMSPNPAFGNQTQGVPVPAGVTVDDVTEQLGVLLTRHETLRTVFRADGAGDGVQEVLSRGELNVRLVSASQQDQDLLALVARQEQALLGEPFDHGAELPFRAVVGVLDGAPRLILLSQSHLAMDFLGGRILANELTALLTARAQGLPAPPAPSARQPVDQAEFERSARGLQLADRSLRYWRAELLRGPDSMFPLSVEPATPRYWRGAIRSRAVPSAVALLAARYKVSTSVILFAAMSALLGRSAGRDRCLARIVAGNRISAELRHAVGNFTQEVPAAIDLSGGTFKSAVSSTWSAMLRAFRNAQYPPEQADGLVAELARERGAGIDLSLCFNDLWSPVHGHDPAAITLPEKIERTADDTSFIWEDHVVRAGVSLFLEVTGTPDELSDPGAARLSLLADTSHVPPAAIISFLSGLERLLVRLAKEEIDLRRIEPVPGLTGLNRTP